MDTEAVRIIPKQKVPGEAHKRTVACGAPFDDSNGAKTKKTFTALCQAGTH